ncbi:MAG: DUF3572 domain-containing protein [Parvibaculaceae bacterium]
MNASKFQPPAVEAEILALDALRFLASEPDRIGRFMAMTGLKAADLMATAAHPALLAAVLDHLLFDETLLHLFAEETGISPEAVPAARQKLPFPPSRS